MGVKKRRINKLVELFNEKECLTADYIKQELGINDRSVKSYIGFLRSHGLEIIYINQKYTVIKQDKLSGNFIDKQELRMLKILQVVSENNGCFIKKALVDALCSSLFDENIISRKTIERAIKCCEEKGYIYLDENNKYRVSIETDALCFTNYEDIYKFIELCGLYKESMPFYKEVISLKNKIIAQLNYEETTYNVYCIGRKYSDTTISKDVIKQFENLNYRKKALRIIYNSKIGELTKDIQIATLLYNWEKDKSYVIGMVKEDLYFIDINSIKSIFATEAENKFFNHKQTMDKVDLMFGASLDGPYDVKVEFKNLFNIKEKLIRLNNHRAQSNLTEIEDKLIYTDKLYGIYDFARYLRSFGLACRVIEPEALRDIMRKTYERILLNYKDEQHEK